MTQQKNSGDYGPDSPEKMGYPLVVRILQKRGFLDERPINERGESEVFPLTVNKYMALCQVKNGWTPGMLDQQPFPGLAAGLLAPRSKTRRPRLRGRSNPIMTGKEPSHLNRLHSFNPAIFIRDYAATLATFTPRCTLASRT
jgi:hypothetical protein